MKKFKVSQIGNFFIVLMCFVTLSFSNVNAQPAPLTIDDLYLGGIRPDDHIDKVIQKYGQPRDIEERQEGHPKMGGYYTVVKYDYGDLIVWFSKRDNKVFSVETTSKNIYTARGIRVGSSDSKMLEVYGNNCQIAGDKMFSYYSYSSSKNVGAYGL